MGGGSKVIKVDRQSGNKVDKVGPPVGRNGTGPAGPARASLPGAGRWGLAEGQPT